VNTEIFFGIIRQAIRRRTPENVTSGQISHDLRRLRAYQIIDYILAYQITEDGLIVALFLIRLTQLHLIPGPSSDHQAAVGSGKPTVPTVTL
jgi:hypothetical protein